MNGSGKRGARVYFPEFDYSYKITTKQSIELPFWIPIKSGEYKLPKRQKIIIHNDLWLVSIANFVDGPLENPFEFIVDEIQVSDDEYLEGISEGNAQYYHKTKMKTTIISNMVHIPPKGWITAELGSESWKEQLHKALRSAGRHMHSTLNDINQFIDYYCSLISMNNYAREVRRVSSFETMVRIFVSIEKDGFQYTYPSTYAPDLRMVGLPFPIYRVRENQNLVLFQDTLETLDVPSFHQLQWIKTLNHEKEERYQEALLSATQTLEALAYSYLTAKDLPESQIKKKGIAKWVIGLVEHMSKYYRQFTHPSRDVEYMAKSVCNEVARLWQIRNTVVHEQKNLLSQDYRTIRHGIANLAHLRQFFLSSINPELLELEKQFSSFLEPVPLSKEPVDFTSQVFSLEYEWRREIDDYQNPVSSTNSDDNGVSEESNEDFNE